jgi:uncharacterized delta-60 repeat protein
VTLRSGACLLVCSCLATVLLASTPSARAADGSLDPAFGDNGKVLTDFGSGLQFAYDVVVQADGRIVVAGGIQTQGFALARYDDDGSPDPSFGGDGMVRTSGFRFPRAGASSIAVYPDGDIVAAGTTFTNPSREERFALARYDNHGRLDPAFGDDGRVWTRFSPRNARASGLAIQTDGKVVVAGGASGDFALARYRRDGTLDASFGGDGKVQTAFGARYSSAEGIAIQADGKIILAGTAGFDDTWFALARYRRDGTLDASFGGDGTVRTRLDSPYASAHGIAIQADGKIVVAGRSSDRARFALARYNLNGSLDASFGGDGTVTTRFRSQATAFDVDIDADGRILVAGVVCCGVEPPGTRFALARYTPDGDLDASFGGDGRVKTAFRFGYGPATALAIQPDGKVVAAGWAGFGHGTVYFAVARYLAS